jgi:phosphomethylpyrimidine synthase
MKITQEVRLYAEEKALSEEAALAAGLEEKAGEFVRGGAELYRPE